MLSEKYLVLLAQVEEPKYVKITQTQLEKISLTRDEIMHMFATKGEEAGLTKILPDGVAVEGPKGPFVYHTSAADCNKFAEHFPDGFEYVVQSQDITINCKVQSLCVVPEEMLEKPDADGTIRIAGKKLAENFVFL